MGEYHVRNTHPESLAHDAAKRLEIRTALAALVRTAERQVERSGQTLRTFTKTETEGKARFDPSLQDQAAAQTSLAREAAEQDRRLLETLRMALG